jgi:hypothetical protein
MVLQKNIPFAQGRALQLRVEAFNVLNHINEGNPNVDMTNVNYGRITGMSGRPRQLQLGLRFVFTHARSIGRHRAPLWTLRGRSFRVSGGCRRRARDRRRRRHAPWTCRSHGEGGRRDAGRRRQQTGARRAS